MSIKQMRGFTLEVFSFVFSGYLLGTGKFTQSYILLLFAFFCAVWTGEQIKKDCLTCNKKEEYDNGNV